MRPELTRRVTEKQIATELGITGAQCARLLRLHGVWLRAGRRKERGAWRYDAEVIEILRGLMGQPHRQLSPAETDWLSRYVERNINE